MTAMLKQCKTCPWRVDCEPERDIPRYDLKLARELSCTIRSGAESMRGGDSQRAMACHYSEPGNEIYCAGWIANQIGPGNNLGLRLLVMRGLVPMPETDGPQHERFEDTLPKAKRKPARR